LRSASGRTGQNWMLHILETLSHNNARVNAKRSIDSPIHRPITKRVKSAHKLTVPEVPHGDEDLFCKAYLQDIARTMQCECEALALGNSFEGFADPERFLKKRRKLLNWLIPIARKQKCSPAVVYKMTQLIDRYFFEKPDEAQDRMQLIGSVALLMASKYHDTYPISFETMVNYSGGAFDFNDVVECEMKVLEVIDFNLTNPLILDFINWFLLNFSKERHQSALKRVSFYLAESLLLEREFLGASPKYHATVAVYWALQMVPRTKWNPKFQELFGVSEEKLQSYAKIILRSAFPNFKLTGVQKVYFDSSTVIGRIFRSKELKSWLQRRCDRHSRRTKSLMLKGTHL